MIFAPELPQPKIPLSADPTVFLKVSVGPLTRKYAGMGKWMPENNAMQVQVTMGDLELVVVQIVNLLQGLSALVEDAVARPVILSLVELQTATILGVLLMYVSLVHAELLFVNDGAGKAVLYLDSPV